MQTCALGRYAACRSPVNCKKSSSKEIFKGPAKTINFSSRPALCLRNPCRYNPRVKLFGFFILVLSLGASLARTQQPGSKDKPQPAPQDKPQTPRLPPQFRVDVNFVSIRFSVRDGAGSF